MEDVMRFESRCADAFLGLAVGDAYGRTLEFVSGERVRTQPVDMGPGAARWTDDTHMAWYLAQAVLQVPAGRLCPDDFGARVGERFVAWIGDPLTPSTAPGTTCMAGTRNWAQCGDWRASGVRSSDGCGAVMRIAPMSMALAGEDLTVAAEVQAALTHGHPNAREAAIAASHLLRWTLEQGRFTREMVLSAVARLDSDWNRGGDVAKSLRDALQVSLRASQWLPESAIAPGDGGWRAGSALGLAVAACLSWWDDPKTVIDRAARINGDSDSVAALAGMFLGAAGRLDELPSDWVANLPWAGKLRGIGARLGLIGRPVIAVADLHGRPALLEKLLRELDQRYADYSVVLLGDYCDNGPDVAGLLQVIWREKSLRGADFQAILGNHDLACLRAMEDALWYKRWARRYWNPNGSTAAQFSAASGSQLLRAMPAHLRETLESLPWVLKTDRYVFVHAGMEGGDLEPQIQSLQAQKLPLERMHLPPQVRDKDLARRSDADWTHVVVSAHTKSTRLGCPVWEGPMRICIGADVESSNAVRSVVLPERRYIVTTGR